MLCTYNTIQTNHLQPQSKCLWKWIIQNVVSKLKILQVSIEHSVGWDVEMEVWPINRQLL